MAKKLKPKEETVPFHVRLPKSVHKDFLALCNDLDVTGGAVIRRMIKVWMDDNESKRRPILETVGTTGVNQK